MENTVSDRFGKIGASSTSFLDVPKMSAFSLLAASTPGELHALGGKFPASLKAWHEPCSIELSNGTHYGFVHEGCVELDCASGNFTLQSGMYFRTPGAMRLENLDSHSSGFVITRVHDHDRDLGFFQLGGPVEEQGRLEYIDGCSDSLLISPAVLGDPWSELVVFASWDRSNSAHTPKLSHGNDRRWIRSLQNAR